MVHAILLTFCIGILDFLVTMDSFAVASALQTLSGNLGIRPEVGAWFVISYSVMNTFCIALSGFFITRYGKRRMLLITVLLFAFFSLCTSFTTHFALFTLLRSLQGACGGLLVPITFMLVLPAFPKERKSFAVALWTLFVITGPITGFVVGGIFSTPLWPLLFRLNIPPLLIALAGVWHLMDKAPEKVHPVPLDFVGILLAFVTLGSLLPALNRGQREDWFHSPLIVFLFITAVIAGTLLLIWERYHRHPFFHLLIFKRRNFVLAVFINGLSMFMLFSSMSLEAFWLQNVLGYPPSSAGYAIGAMAILPLLLYPLVGYYFTLIDRRIWVLIGLLIYAVLFFLLSRINLETTFRYLFWIRFAQGIGLASVTVTLALTAFENIHPEDFPFVLAIYSFSRTLCLSSTSLATALWAHREAFHQMRLAAHSFLDNPLFLNFLHRLPTVGQKDAVALAETFMKGQAYTLGLADLYYLFGWVFLLLCPLLFFLKPPRHSSLVQIDRTHPFAPPPEARA